MLSWDFWKWTNYFIFLTRQELNDRLKKALKDRGNRLNLNIFLSHSTNSQDTEHGISDNDNESTNESTHQIPNTDNNDKKDTEEVELTSKKVNDSTAQNVETVNAKPNSPTSRNTTIINNDNNAEKIFINNASPRDLNGNNLSTTIIASAAPENEPRRRPPLVRAMSAPIRPIDESKMNIQVKRKLRKKKIVNR